MTVLNRSMFRRPSALPPLRGPMPVVRETYPVVQRQAGTPPRGEVQEYIDKGYDTYEYTGDKAQDKGGILKWLKEQGSKAGKKISDFMETGWADREDLLFIGNEYFDPEDPNFRSFIEKHWMEEGDSFIDGIEKWKVFVETSSGRGDDTEMLIEGQQHIVPRQAGTPPTGEISDRFGAKRINELMEVPLGDTGDLSKQWDRDEGVSQFTMEDFIKLEAPNWHAEGELKLVQAFGTQDEVETMIGIVKRLRSPDRDEQQYEEDWKIRRALFDKYVDRIGGLDNYHKTHDRLNREFELREETGKKLYPEMRQAGSPSTGETSYYTQEINPEIVKEQDIALDKQIGSLGQEMNLRNKAQIRALRDDLRKISQGLITSPDEIMFTISGMFTEFGKDATLQMLMNEDFHNTHPQIFQYISSLQTDVDEHFPGFSMINGTDPSGAVSRQLGSPTQGEITPQESNLYYGDQGEQALYAELLKVLRGEIVGIEAQQVMQAAIGEFGEDFIKSLMAQGNNITSPAEGQFSGMPHQGTGMDGPYWRQDPSGAVSRQMGSPPRGEQVVAENVGIMDGFGQNEAQIADTVMTEGEGARDAIDQSNTYDELMRAIRGDDLSEADRRQELASYVGEKDAEETPDSVLALVQPVMQMLDQQTANTGIAQTEEAMMMPNVMPQQQQQRPVGIAHGGPVQHFNQGTPSPLVTKKAEYLPAYMDIVDKYLDPNQGQADALLSLSKAGFNYALGATPTEAGALFFDEVGQKGQARAASEDALKMKTEFAALNAAQASLLADAKATKEKQNYTVGLNNETDKLIAAILGITKTERTRVGPDTDEEIVIDYDRLYEMYPKGSTLQWNWDFSQFLGKKGSSISYTGVDKNKDGGIVHRDEGTPEQGENSEETLEELYQKHGFIFDPPLITGAGERDKISKILFGTDAALQELMEMKQHLVDDPTLGGLPGLFLEKTRGLFTMFDQLDNAYLNDEYIKEGSGIFKFFDRPAITEIYKSKKRISKALADLASFKGARQPIQAQTEETKQEVDPTGGFGATVSMEKIDAVGDEFVLLIKELLRGLGGPDVVYKAGKGMDPIVEGAKVQDSILRATVDQEYLTTQFDKLDAYINQLKTLVPTEGSRSEVEEQAKELQNIKSLTIEEYEDLFGKILSEAEGE